MSESSRNFGPAPAPLLFLDHRGGVTWANQAAHDLLGYASGELHGLDLRAVLSANTTETSALAEVLAGREPATAPNRRTPVSAHHRDGAFLELEVTLSPLPEPRQGWVVVLHQADKEGTGDPHPLLDLYYDAETGLPGRLLFAERLEQTAQRLGQHKRHAAVLLLDLDRFKRINHALGYGHGDRLLAMVGERLGGELRPGDTVARIGEDEFAILLNDVARLEDIHPIARRLLRALESPFPMADQEIFLTASVGISLCPDDALGAEDLLRQAGMAQAIAKDPYHNNCSFFTEELNERAWHRLQLETDLNRALHNDELVLHYQPVVSLINGSIKGVEALVRWQHPQRGMVSPGEFIPLMEDIGLIQEVGEWIARTAIAQLAAWRDQGLPPVRMNINLSPRQFAQPDLVDQLLAIAEAYAVNPGKIQLEITENLFMHDLPNADNMLFRLHEAGFPLALDDFGTGYSALNYLRSFPFRVLKIDRSFLWHIPTDLEETALLRSIVDLADTLSIPTVPEGVETQDQADFLQWLGCTEAQGFGFSRPAPAEDITRMLAEGPQFPIRVSS